MTNSDLGAFSDAIATIAEDASVHTASFTTGHGRTATAFHWADGFYVAAEEAIEPDEEQRLILGGGEVVTAELAGRDPSTGIALLKADVGQGVAFVKAAPVRPGNMIVATGRDGGSSLAVLGTVGEVGPEWRSLRGGTIDRRINLAIMAGSRFEGGPVLDATGGLVGMLLFGPRRRALVIPYETIERTVSILKSRGYVMRGYLGAGLHPVREGSLQGAIVVGLDDEGPAKAAGLVLGDIVTGWNGEPVRGPRELIRKLGPDSAGATVTLAIVRGGEARDVAVAIGEKPLS